MALPMPSHFRCLANSKIRLSPTTTLSKDFLTLAKLPALLPGSPRLKAKMERLPTKKITMRQRIEQRHRALATSP